MSDRRLALVQDDIADRMLRALVANRSQRARAEIERHALQVEAITLMAAGLCVGVGVAELAERAGVTEETVHRWLREKP